MYALAWAESKKSKPDFKNMPMGSRGHFGDLQFLHAMAPGGEPAAVTRSKILTWIEFDYRASYGEFDLSADVHSLPVAGIDRFFMKGARKVRDVLDYCRPHEKERSKAIALGQLLHIIQDSFAGCHAGRRADGAIESFYSFEEQSTEKHGKFDSVADWAQVGRLDGISPVAFTRKVLELRGRGVKWNDAKPEFEKMFALSSDATVAAGGGEKCCK
jgi:hypothetical protein